MKKRTALLAGYAYYLGRIDLAGETKRYFDHTKGKPMAQRLASSAIFSVIVPPMVPLEMLLKATGNYDKYLAKLNENTEVLRFKVSMQSYERNNTKPASTVK